MILVARERDRERSEHNPLTTSHQPLVTQPDLFADFNGLPNDASRTEFYKHDANWTNRMILGDSLQVMASLAEREGLRGQVQCIYLDPPYGIKFNSNFQWSTTSRDVKDGNVQHITREPEQVKAFRDTWRDGIHSYLTYLRDRLTVARDLLSDSGSIFVQIGDENVHNIRSLLNEVFGEDNFVSMITVSKTSSQTSSTIASISDYVLWYARNISNIKYRVIKKIKDPNEAGTGASDYKHLWLGNDTRKSLSAATENEIKRYKLFTASPTTSQSGSETTRVDIKFNGRVFKPGNGGWKTNAKGFSRLIHADRIMSRTNSLRYVRFLEDYPVVPLTNLWNDVRWGFDATLKRYVVETNPQVIARSIQMATDPGDLVLDPTCGSGTTAYVAEQWGRRWITIDTSRVSLALARARIMGARYPYYLLSDSPEGQQKDAEITRSAPPSQPTHGDIRQGFVYERVPHITLKSIANNAEIDVIWEKFQEKLEPLRLRLNEELRIWNSERKTTSEIQHSQFTIPNLPWDEWEIPRDADESWPTEARRLHEQWWGQRIARQKEIDASIAAKADFEYLYDKPYEDKNVVRVAGPFTVESLSPHRVLGVDENDELIVRSEKSEVRSVKEASAVYHSSPFTLHHSGEADFASMILENLKTAGVQQAHKEDKITFTSLTPWPGDLICAVGTVASDQWLVTSEEGRAHHPQATNRKPLTTEHRCAVFIGPEFGTVSRPDLVAAAREAGDADFDVLIACAFNYDAHSSEFDKLGRIPVLKARMNADLHMADDLKNTGKGNLFVIFGEPDVEVTSGQWIVTSCGRMVANYDRVKELSGLGSLEEVNRLGRTDLQRLKQVSSGREVRSDQSDTAGGGIGTGEHRRGRGADRDGRVSTISERGERIVGRSGNFSDSSGAAGISAGSGPAGAGDEGGRNQPHARWTQEVAAIQALSPNDFPLSLTTSHYSQVTVHGVDVFHPQTGEVRSDGPEGIACWFIDTDYNEESFFVRHAYFLGANDPYKALKTTLKAEINEDAWATLHSDTSRPFPKPRSGRIAVKVINHLGDEVMKVFRV